jgi:UDP-glucuronate 4-epimerase
VSERFLVTGALGCLGAWTLRTLVREGVPAVGFDLGESRHRLELILDEQELEQVELVRGDVTDLDALEHALREHEITHVVHLAALQIPFAKADPVRGAQVNVVGTVTVFEAVKNHRDRVRGLAYASSAAVFGGSVDGLVGEDAPPDPVTHYGVHKVANEGAARVYWLDDGVPSVGLRPYVVYGPGRDQGLTAGPTLAMNAAARGEPYRIPFGGRAQYQYAPDAARAFVDAARTCDEGAVVANLGGPPVHMSEIVTAIEAAVPDAAGTITFEDVQLPLPGAFEARMRPARVTPIEVGVRETVEVFRARAPR